MDIENSVQRSVKQQAIIKSLVWNSVVEVFKEKKDIDIAPYLGSVQLKGTNIFIKTTKSILKSEMLLLDDIIKENIDKKFKKVGIRFPKMEIKYI